MKQFTGLLFIIFSLIWQTPALASVNGLNAGHDCVIFADDDKKSGDKKEGDEDEEEEEEPDCD